jgi:hypothetical protein
VSGQPKKGFSAFLRPSAPPETVAAQEASPPANVVSQPRVTAPPEAPPERIRHVTSTGRVRTHSANRMLPGVTLRLSEEKWERLKMLSIQERRPIQDILGEALDGYMKGRGLPW